MSFRFVISDSCTYCLDAGYLACINSQKKMNGDALDTVDFALDDPHGTFHPWDEWGSLYYSKTYSISVCVHQLGERRKSRDN